MSNKTLNVVEIFGGNAKWAIQGEGYFAGAPSTFIRTFGCNLFCKFGVTRDPELARSWENQLKNYIKHFPDSTLEELPLTRLCCDTYYSVFPEYSKFAKQYTVEQLTSYIYELRNGISPSQHLVFTGGEPLLPGCQQFYTQFIPMIEKECGIQHITFETNATQNLVPDFEDSDFIPRISFSMSPKLSSAGYSIEQNCNPKAVQQYIDFARNHDGKAWFKFVVNKESDCEEIQKYISECGLNNSEIPVFLMPEGGTKQQLEKNEQNVYMLCSKYGYYYSPRLQVSVMNNGIGI